MAPRIPDSARPPFRFTPAEQAAVDKAIARLDEEAGPLTEAEIWAYDTIYAPSLEAVLARKQEEADAAEKAKKKTRSPARR